MPAESTRNGKTLSERLYIIEAKVVELEGVIESLKTEVVSLRRATVAFAFTVAASAVAVLVGVR